MKARSVLVALCSLVMVAAVACAPTAQQGESAVSTQEAMDALNALADAWDAGINSADADGILAMYADNPGMMPPNEPAVVGKEAMRAWLENFFAGNPQVKNTAEGVEVSGDLFVGFGAYTLTATSESGEAIEDDGKWMAIFRRQADGSWKAIRNIWNSNNPPAGEGS